MCTALTFFPGSQTGPESAFTWCQPLTGKVSVYSAGLVDLMQESLFPVELRRILQLISYSYW